MNKLDTPWALRRMSFVPMLKMMFLMFRVVGSTTLLLVSFRRPVYSLSILSEASLINAPLLEQLIKFALLDLPTIFLGSILVVMELPIRIVVLSCLSLFSNVSSTRLPGFCAVIGTTSLKEMHTLWPVPWQSG